ncbi:hypothetical protein RYD26_11940 [Pasteurellaceae bacterium LIM206]|nr:hypothetical protein [Pasteurellaceae bacterium LIM206]
MGEGDFDGISESLKKKNFPHRTFAVGEESIACVSISGFPEKMDIEAPRARKITEKELFN